MIKQLEGLRLKPYRDSGGKWTIGYGHLIKDNEPELRRKQGITQKDADNLLFNDIAIAERAITDNVQTPLNIAQFDALVSLIFNIGVGAFRSSTLLKKLNQKNYAEAASEFPRWRYVGTVESSALLKRRAIEQDMFLS